MFEVKKCEKEEKILANYIPVKIANEENAIYPRKESGLKIEGENSNINSERQQKMGEKMLPQKNEDSHENRKKEMAILLGKRRQRLEGLITRETLQKRKKINEEIREKNEKIKELQEEMQRLQSDVQALKSKEEKLDSEEKQKKSELNDDITFQQSNYLESIDEEEKIKKIMGDFTK